MFFLFFFGRIQRKEGDDSDTDSCFDKGDQQFNKRYDKNIDLRRRNSRSSDKKPKRSRVYQLFAFHEVRIL